MTSLLHSAVWAVTAKRDDYAPIDYDRPSRPRWSTLSLSVGQDIGLVLAEALLLYQSIFTLCSTA